MITSKKELDFYILADRMMNRGYFRPTPAQRLKRLLFPDLIMDFLESMRRCQYYSRTRGAAARLLHTLHRLRFVRLSRRLGFSIGHDVFGYGLVIPHHGTIVVGRSNSAGNYCVLQPSTCISDNGKLIGDALYMAAGATVTRSVTLGPNVSVAANSVVNASFEKGNCLLAGMPAERKRDAEPWYIRDGEKYSDKVARVEALRRDLFPD